MRRALEAIRLAEGSGFGSIHYLWSEMLAGILTTCGVLAMLLLMAAGARRTVMLGGRPDAVPDAGAAAAVAGGMAAYVAAWFSVRSIEDEGLTAGRLRTWLGELVIVPPVITVAAILLGGLR
ncbi:MAG: hypothetical protein QJR08_00385 [Bacillota bacterium]|nr:hypothetical protein [Bacillota bacterium]